MSAPFILGCRNYLRFFKFIMTPLGEKWCRRSFRRFGSTVDKSSWAPFYLLPPNLETNVLKIYARLQSINSPYGALGGPPHLLFLIWHNTRCWLGYLGAVHCKFSSSTLTVYLVSKLNAPQGRKKWKHGNKLIFTTQNKPSWFLINTLVKMIHLVRGARLIWPGLQCTTTRCCWSSLWYAKCSSYQTFRNYTQCSSNATMCNFNKETWASTRILTCSKNNYNLWCGAGAASGAGAKAVMWCGWSDMKIQYVEKYRDGKYFV
jgi:hypothetical protein